MTVSAIIGAQWGDEGKGKVVDTFSEKADYVVRFQGGNNAGHTIIIDGKKSVLHSLPSGIMRKQTRNIIGQGCVVNLADLYLEMRNFYTETGEGIRPPRLVISENASIILPYHILLDNLREQAKGKLKIGTTGKGIGPAYEDNVGRRAIRMVDLFDRDCLAEKIKNNLIEKNAMIIALGGEPLTWEHCLLRLHIGFFQDFVSDTESDLRHAIQNGQNVLFEGAQGTLLDVVHGTYPFVTSSQTTVNGITQGAGVPLSDVDSRYGVVKAYQTRVGAGPFPTELTNETGNWLRTKGKEYGATTGRPRRCGWLDIPLLNKSVRLNQFTDIALMKLDVLSGLTKIRMCVKYDSNPSASPQYLDYKGWEEDISSVRHFDELPKAAQNYVLAIEKRINVRISMIGVGPGREDKIIRRKDNE